MDNKVKAIFDDYIASVNEVCCRLLNGINEQEKLKLRTKWDFFEYRSITRKMEFDINGIIYRLHGNGCFAFSDELFLNWNFGYRSRWCGIEPWIVGMTLKKNNSDHIEYYDGELLKKACEKALQDGEMFEKNGLYHYSIPMKETFIPDFPKEYETLAIERFDDKWVLPRNKIIDRFMRKSNRVYNQVHNNENKYSLKFLLDEKEIYSIPYDDISYPENAIKIMSDEIIWNLKKKSS